MLYQVDSRVGPALIILKPLGPHAHAFGVGPRAQIDSRSWDKNRYIVLQAGYHRSYGSCLPSVEIVGVSHRPGAVAIVLDPLYPLPYLLEHKRPPASFFVLLASWHAGRRMLISCAGVPVEDIAVAPVHRRAPPPNGQPCLVSEFPLRAFPTLHALGITERVQQLLHGGS